MCSGDLRAIRARLRETDVDDSRYTDACKQFELANRSVFLSYSWARAELQSKTKPLALSALRMKPGSALGGSKGAVTRLKVSEVKWRSSARQIAIRFASKNPRHRRQRSLRKLSSGGKVKIHHPATRHLKKYVARLERDGQLAKRAAKSGRVSKPGVARQ
jgi:hypothetical protein